MKNLFQWRFLQYGPGADQYLVASGKWQVWIQVFWYVTLCRWFSGSGRFEKI
jgi:hypothetical protein